MPRAIKKTPTGSQPQRPLTKAQLSKLRQALARVPYAQLLGIEIISATVGSATLRLEMRPELEQIHGVMHGGAVASLIDTATAFAIVSILKQEEKFVTIDLTLTYLRPLTSGPATATASILRAGRRVIAVSAEVRDDSGKLTATALSTYLRLS